VRVSEYTRLSQKNLQKAQALIAQGDYHQASEKLWGATASMVKAMAEGRGWPHESHRKLNLVISRLAQETGRRELIRLFGLANALHTNFYEDWLTPEQVVEFAASVRELLDELRRVVQV
jgi:uncharacterized protein (UPF0332 family)